MQRPCYDLARTPENPPPRTASRMTEVTFSSKSSIPLMSPLITRLTVMPTPPRPNGMTASGPEAVVPLGRGRGAGMTINLVINGDINGFDDFQQKVTSVIRDAVLGGGFSGVLARA